MSYYKLFQSICRRLFKPPEGNDAVSVFDPTDQIQSDSDELTEVTRRLNAAFLILLAGQKHPDLKKLRRFYNRPPNRRTGRKLHDFIWPQQIVSTKKLKMCASGIRILQPG